MGDEMGAEMRSAYQLAYRRAFAGNNRSAMDRERDRFRAGGVLTFVQQQTHV